MCNVWYVSSVRKHILSVKAVQINEYVTLTSYVTYVFSIDISVKMISK